jgi:hypothetical protein
MRSALLVWIFGLYFSFRFCSNAARMTWLNGALGAPQGGKRAAARHLPATGPR